MKEFESSHRALKKGWVTKRQYKPWTSKDALFNLVLQCPNDMKTNKSIVKYSELKHYHWEIHKMEYLAVKTVNTETPDCPALRGHNRQNNKEGRQSQMEKENFKQ